MLMRRVRRDIPLEYATASYRVPLENSPFGCTHIQSINSITTVRIQLAQPALSHCYYSIILSGVHRRIGRGSAPSVRQRRCWVVQRGEIEGQGTANRRDISVAPCCSHRTESPTRRDRAPGMDLPEAALPLMAPLSRVGFCRKQVQVKPSAFRCSGQAKGRLGCSRSMAAVRFGGWRPSRIARVMSGAR